MINNEICTKLNLSDIVTCFYEKEITTVALPKNTPILKEILLPEILFISSYPPRECGIATYSYDLIQSIDQKFGNSIVTSVCAMELNGDSYNYNTKVRYILNTQDTLSYATLSETINRDCRIKLAVVQHEFGFFSGSKGNDFQNFLEKTEKPVIVVFHTVLPRPDKNLKTIVKSIADSSKSLIVMTKASAEILINDYSIRKEKIDVISHGTHLVTNNNKTYLKKKYGYSKLKLLTTFGLLGPGKGIETTLNAIPEIVKKNPEVLFLLIGKTHPGIIKSEGEIYRNMLEEKVASLGIGKYVRFINKYIELPVLLEYLRMTDIYLFTSRDPNQAVSGTFSYAMSCGCPVISTPIPQALEMTTDNTGIIIDFQDSEALAKGVSLLLNDNILRNDFSLNTLHKIAPTAWENSAVSHGLLFAEAMNGRIELLYSIPEINLNHIKLLTNDFGMIQFSKINIPDMKSGYTLDDNARALISISMHYEISQNKSDLELMKTYLSFINFCIKKNGSYVNYVDENKNITSQNRQTNLEDAAGRAIWALGYLYSQQKGIPAYMRIMAEELIKRSFNNIKKTFSARAMAFNIKGLYYYNKGNSTPAAVQLIEILADRLAAMYKHESTHKWNWFESYMTYANSALPEAMLMAGLCLKKTKYFEIAKESFDFLLSNTFINNEIKVISNTSWFKKGGNRDLFGEQPIDVSYSILALHNFYLHFHQEHYLTKMRNAFSWFHGNNHLKRIIYNPRTGGCYDGLEEFHVNLNQGAESTVCYLMARMVMESYIPKYKSDTKTIV